MKQLRMNWLPLLVWVAIGLSFSACENKAEGGGGDVSGNSLVGTWKCTRTYGDNATQETLTLCFNADHTGTYMVETSHDTPEINEMRYNYDPTTCLGNFVLLLEPQQRDFTMDFKIQWYGENSMVLYFKNPEPASEAETWYAVGTFARQSNGGGTTTTPDDTYSLVGKWKYYENNAKEGPHTEIIQFNADGTGTWQVISENVTGGVTTYTLTYTYDQKTCEGSLMQMYTYPSGEKFYNPMDFKIKWYGADNIVFSTRYQEGTQWYDMILERQ